MASRITEQKAHSLNSLRVQKKGTPRRQPRNRGIADRQQAAADVADEEDEEDHGVPAMHAFAVGLKQGSES